MRRDKREDETRQDTRRDMKRDKNFLVLTRILSQETS